VALTLSPGCHLSTCEPTASTTPSHTSAPAEAGPRAGNGLVSVAPASGLAPTVEIEAECIGEVSASGYLIDITVIDRAVREHLSPILLAALRAELDGTPTDLHALLRRCASTLAPALPARLSMLAYRSSPFRTAALEPAADETPNAKGLQPMNDAFVLSETFEFAASHRLHLPGATDAENRAMFGKCNNPNGHGHNYRIEVSVEVSGEVAGAAEVAGKARGEVDFAAIERIVQSEIMARFDHKHLNLDCPEFANLNPSVEHIAMVCHGILAPRFAERGASLRSVRVWETEKTSCRYPA
jgi:6-pyruvoyltetrahydropterin/6-carboxytetrahydropterin synthase